jgi:hypothetical protein
MRFFLIVVFITISVGLVAQQDVQIEATPQHSYDSIRSTYIKSFPEHFFVWPVIKQRKLDFEMQPSGERKEALEFKSNRPYSVGVGLYLFELGVEIAFALPVNDRSKAIYGDSHTRDLQLNAYGKRWGADLYYQNYEGFYVDDLAKDVPSGTPYPQRPDIETRNIGITGNYVINSKKFSFRSAYNFAERQLRSAGTPVIFTSLNAFKTFGDSAIIGDQYATRFGKGSNIKQISVNTLGVAPGYAYNFIYKGFFLNGTLAIGPSHNWLSYSRDDGEKITENKINIYVIARLSVGFNGDHFFGGLTFASQSRSAKFDNLTLSSANSSFKILFGYRIRETGFLKKRIWDLPKSFKKK